jgi:cell division protein FtsB
VWWWSGGAAVILGLFLVIATVAGSALLGSDGVTRLLHLRAERQDLGQAAVRRLQENAALRAEIARLRADPAYLEGLARRRLGLVRPDEMAYRFLDDDDAAP